VESAIQSPPVANVCCAAPHISLHKPSLIMAISSIINRAEDSLLPESGLDVSAITEDLLLKSNFIVLFDFNGSFNHVGKNSCIIAKNMSTEKIDDFAETDPKNLPKEVKKEIKEFIIRNIIKEEIRKIRR